MLRLFVLFHFFIKNEYLLFKYVCYFKEHVKISYVFCYIFFECIRNKTIASWLKETSQKRWRLSDWDELQNWNVERNVNLAQ